MLKRSFHYVGASAILFFIALSTQAMELLKIDNPLSTDSPQELVGLIIKALLGLIGAVALIYFIAGGFMWMTAGGNMDKIKKGRDTLVWATLGLVIIFSAYSIIRFIFDILPT